MRQKSYSFIKPRLKPIFSLFSKIWILLIGVTLAVFLAINISINILTLSLNQKNAEISTRYDEIFTQITIAQSEFQTLTTRRDMALNIYSQNKILQKSLQNIFDIVPDSITLNRVILDQNELTLKGITPSKETFELLLQAPLKSIFSTSHTTFYQIQNGWFNFVSQNKIDEDTDE